VSETVGERIRRLRKEKGMSQRTLSTLAPAASHPYVSRIESGDRQPSLTVLRQLAKALDVSPVYLETGQSKVCPHCGSRLENVNK
jgi:transcriptional regulator with XRE-family HTH domain